MYLLFDIGGTNTRVAVSRDGKNFEEPRIFPTPADFGVGISLLVKNARELTGGEKINCAVGGLPGVLNKDKSILISAPNLKGWENRPLKRDLESALSVPVHLENDAALAALGEAVYGAGKGKRIVAYLTISTGVGGARVTDAKIDASAFGFEPGWQIITMDGKDLGAFVSGASLEWNFGKKPESIDGSAVWADATRALAIGIHNTILHWSPDVVVLGGAVMRGRISIDEITLALKKTMRIFPELPEIKEAELGDLSGLYGALVLAREIVLS